MRLLITSVLLVPIVAGCGGSDREAKPDTTPTKSQESTATVNQYASVVASNQDLFDLVDDMQNCNWLAGDLDYGSATRTCGISVLTLSYSSASLAEQLEGAAREGVPAYIGKPPAELVDLIEETTESALTMSAAAQAVADADCALEWRANCLGVRSDAWKARSDLESVLDSWQPYL